MPRIKIPVGGRISLDEFGVEVAQAINDFDEAIGSLPGSNVGYQSSTAGDYSIAAGAHSLVQNITVSLIGGVTYRVSYETDVSGGSGSSLMHLKHSAVGGALSTGSTSLGIRWVNMGSLIPVFMSRNFTPPTTGTYVIGGSLNFFSGSGTGTVRRGGSSSDGVIIVDRISR